MDKSRSGKSVHGLSDMNPEQVAARMNEIAKHLDAVDALLDDAKQLDAAQRKAVARLRGEPEVAALTSVLQFAALHDELYASLADEDEGTDPTKFETDVLANRLKNAQTLFGMGDRITALQAKLSSCALYTTQLVKPIVLKAYEVGKPFADRVSHGELLFPARDYYRAAALSAAKKRAQNAAAKAASKATPTAGSTGSSGSS